MMKAILILILILPLTSVAASNVLYSGNDQVVYLDKGVKHKGYWTVDKDGVPLKFLGPANQQKKVYEKDGVHSLILREPRRLENKFPPFPNIQPTMTEKSCTQVNLVPKLGPVREQTGATCYAYVATDLLTFDNPKEFSALQLAISRPLKEKSWPRPDQKYEHVGGMMYGRIRPAVELGMEQGLCPEERAPSSEKSLGNDYKSLIEYYKEIKYKRMRMDDICRQDLKSVGEEFPQTLEKIMRANERYKKSLIRPEVVKAEIFRLFPTISDESITRIHNSCQSPDECIKSMIQDVCKEHLVKGLPPGRGPKDIREINNLFYLNEEIHFNEKRPKYYYEEERLEILNLVNRSLDQKRPVGLSYVSGGLILPPNEEVHANHASVVAGRSWHPEKKDSSGKTVTPAGCYYLIKNSWGEDWKVKEGLKARSSSEHPGYFIMSEQQLLEHSYGAVTIE